jgi:hypothetical protein
MRIEFRVAKRYCDDSRMLSLSRLVRPGHGINNAESGESVMKKTICACLGGVLLAAGCMQTGPAVSGSGGTAATDNLVKLGQWTPNKDTKIPVKAASGPIVADGKLNEAAWKQAVALGDFILGRSQRPEVDTRVLVTYDKDNLYVAVISSEPDTGNLVAAAKGPDGTVWDDDSIEIYLDPGNQKTREFFAFMVNTKNVTYDRTRNSSWSGTWTSGASVIPGQAWIAETAIPFKTLGISATPELKLGLMVARSRKAGSRNQSFYLAPCEDEAKNTSVYPVLELK